MKKLFLLSYICLIVMRTDAQVLIAYYPLDNNASDLSGYENPGTLMQVTTASDRFNQSAKALQFNGTNSQISIPNNSLFALTSQFSICAWVKPTSTPPAANSGNGFTLVSKNEGPGNNIPKWIFALQNGVLAFHINGPGLVNGVWLYSNTFTVTTNEWYHCAMSKTGNQVSFYVNGQNMGTFTLSASSVNPSSPLLLGASEPGQTMLGAMDEVKVFNYGLSPQEIGDEFANSSLVLSLPLNGNANDVSSLNNNGSIVGTLPAVNDRAGNPNAAMQFDGTGNTYISIPHSSSLQLTNRYTLSAWVKPIAFNQASCQANFILSKGGQASEGHYSLSYGDFLDGNCALYSPQLENFAAIQRRGNTEFGTYQTPLSRPVSLDRWYYVVCTVDSNLQKLYVNGQLTATSTLSGSFGALNTQAMFIGRNVSGNVYPVNGVIDEIKIHNVALPATHIFDTYVNDIKRPGSGNAIRLTGTGSLLTSPYINLGNGFDFGSQPFTYETWVKRNTLGTTLNNYGKALIVGDQNGTWGIGILNDQRLFFTKVGVNFVASTGTLSDTNWHHVAVVYTGTQIQFYIDGVAAGSPAYTSTFTNASGNYHIGARQSFGNSNGDQTPDSDLDETRVWRNVALTQQQIRDWMCRKISSLHPAFSKLYAYFRMDEDYTWTTDGFNAKFGTLMNSPMRKVSGAPLGVDAKHDYVNPTKTVTLEHVGGESLVVTSSSGNPTGMHVYRVDEQPNSLTGAVGVGGNNKYFGVFQTGGSSPVYTAVYNYSGNPYVNPSNENQLRLNKRNNNASASWSIISTVPNEPANTITITGQNTEYLLGKTGTPLQATLNLKLYLQGYYFNSMMAPVLLNQGVGSNLNLVDTIFVKLRRTDPPYTVVSTSSALLNTDGTAVCYFPVVPGYYYLEVNHRNTLQTWSSAPVFISSGTYDFSNASSKAFGNTQIELKPGVWGLYSGEFNQDENTDLLDIALLETDISNFQFGFFETDINGDGNVDLLDVPVLEDNVNQFIFSLHP